MSFSEKKKISLLTLPIIGPHWVNAEESEGTDEEKRSCCSGGGLGGV